MPLRLAQRGRGEDCSASALLPLNGLSSKAWLCVRWKELTLAPKTQAKGEGGREDTIDGPRGARRRMLLGNVGSHSQIRGRHLDAGRLYRRRRSQGDLPQA